MFDGSTIFTRDQLGQNVNSIMSFNEIAFAGGSLSASMETRRTAGNGNVDLSNVKVELWRIS